AGGRFVAPANSFYLSPGGDLASPGYGVLRFTTPAGHAAKYQVETAVATIFPEPPQDGARFFVLKNDKILTEHFLGSREATLYSNELALAEGDSIEFAVGRNTNDEATASTIGISVKLTELRGHSTSNQCIPPLLDLSIWLPFDGTTENQVDGSFVPTSGPVEFVPGIIG